jgi:hypothetical protein
LVDGASIVEQWAIPPLQSSAARNFQGASNSVKNNMQMDRWEIFHIGTNKIGQSQKRAEILKNFMARSKRIVGRDRLSIYSLSPKSARLSSISLSVAVSSAITGSNWLTLPRKLDNGPAWRISIWRSISARFQKLLAVALFDLGHTPTFIPLEVCEGFTRMTALTD